MELPMSTQIPAGTTLADLRDALAAATTAGIPDTATYTPMATGGAREGACALAVKWTLTTETQA